MSVENLSIARRWFEEVWNQRRRELIGEFIAEDGVSRGDLGELRGVREFVERMYDPFVSAFPDLHLTVDRIIAHGDEAVVCWKAEGTHRGEGLGFPPSGQPISFSGSTWIRFQDGKMVEGREYWNQREVIENLRAASEAPRNA